MASEFHKRAISRISPEKRALMVKSLEIISQIHAILDKQDISQKTLSEMLNVSQPAVSKMLIPGGNLEINTIIKLELLLGETIITTPQKVESDKQAKYFKLPIHHDTNQAFMKVAYKAAEETSRTISITG